VAEAVAGTEPQNASRSRRRPRGGAAPASVVADSSSSPINRVSGSDGYYSPPPPLRSLPQRLLRVDDRWKSGVNLDTSRPKAKPELANVPAARHIEALHAHSADARIAEIGARRGLSTRAAGRRRLGALVGPVWSPPTRALIHASMRSP
jgi:hypothetical protein